MTPTEHRSRALSAAAPVAYRSGAVAQMLGMPVATLRVWERRYALTHTERSASGRRLYSGEDVGRLVLLKQLTDLGHAIGSVASLDLPQLQRVAATHAQAQVQAQVQAQARAEAQARAQAEAQAQGQALAQQAAPQRTPWPVNGALQSAPQTVRLVVIGKALAARLHRPALLRQIGRPVELLGPFNDVAQAVTEMAARSQGMAAQAWLLHQPELHEGWLADFNAAVAGLNDAIRPAEGAVPIALLYGYAADATCETVAAGGVTLLREPQPDVALAQWLRQWTDATVLKQAELAQMQTRAQGQGPRQAQGQAQEQKQGPGQEQGSQAIAPRRWSDAALSEFASLSTAVACECPRHVAELLMQLSRFEAYSAQCEQRRPRDAALHATLVRVAAESRTRFEGALEQVALHEGLLLPAAVD